MTPLLFFVNSIHDAPRGIPSFLRDVPLLNQDGDQDDQDGQPHDRQFRFAAAFVDARHVDDPDRVVGRTRHERRPSRVEPDARRREIVGFEDRHDWLQKERKSDGKGGRR